MHITADRRGLKLSLARSQPMVVLYATSLFPASFEARLSDLLLGCQGMHCCLWTWISAEMFLL